MAKAPFTVLAPAKINLYLGVHSQTDERGYHRVDSVMAALDLCDELLFEPADELSVTIDTAPDLPRERNSAWRAARAMEEAFGREANVAVSVAKRIPLCAGLGGPSTDAASVILGLCELWGIDAHDPRCDEVARSIGADVPFFLHESPSFYRGGGDVFAEGFDPLEPLPVVLVKDAEARVSTPEAYRTFDAAPVLAAPVEPMLQALRAGDAATALGLIANNLAPVAEKVEPRVGETLAWLRAQEGIRALDVCGSGACTFAVCDTPERAAELARTAAEEHGWWSAATALR